jgi:DNA-binding transcriptional MerR regulator
MASGWAEPPEGIYSIGAVASMLGLPAATLRTWEERYAVVSPIRTAAGHRLYSRDQVEQLRFIAAEMEKGMSAADAHRSLAGRAQEVGRVPEPSHTAKSRVLLILVADRDEYSAELIEHLLGTEGFIVEVTLDVEEAKRKFEELRPHLCVIEFLMSGGGEELCGWLKQQGGTPILVVSSLDVADRALNCGAEAFLRKPVDRLELISVVKDLLGVSALVRRAGSER